jgi:hypothetical protein
MTVFDKKQTFEIPGWFQRWLPLVGLFVHDQIQKEIAGLKARIEELETKGINFCGSYQRANRYRRGEWVGYDGSAWVALSDVQPLEQPGASDKWQLIVRAGRDAREQRLPTRGGPSPETTIHHRRT